jgi:hypothetical protein
MAKKRKAIPRREELPPLAKSEAPVFASPFKDLKKLIDQRAAEIRRAPSMPPQPATQTPAAARFLHQAAGASSR